MTITPRDELIKSYTKIFNNRCYDTHPPKDQIEELSRAFINGSGEETNQELREIVSAIARLNL